MAAKKNRQMSRESIDKASLARSRTADNAWLDRLGGPLFADSPHLKFLACRLAFPNAELDFSKI
jgi:hypothetical protein